MAWRFRTFVSGNGRNDSQQEIDRYSDEAQEHLRVAVKWLGEAAKLAWHEPHGKKLKGYRDLYEIRFKANGIQHRPAGYFGPGSNEFTILVVATKKGDRYNPASAFDTADTRRKSLESGQATTAPLFIDGEEI